MRKKPVLGKIRLMCFFSPFFFIFLPCMLILLFDWYIWVMLMWCWDKSKQGRGGEKTREFLIFSSEVVFFLFFLIEFLLEWTSPPPPPPPLRPCQSHLRKSERGGLEACRGSLGPDRGGGGREREREKERERDERACHSTWWQFDTTNQTAKNEDKQWEKCCRDHCLSVYYL